MSSGRNHIWVSELNDSEEKCDVVLGNYETVMIDGVVYFYAHKILYRLQDVESVLPPIVHFVEIVSEESVRWVGFNRKHLDSKGYWKRVSWFDTFSHCEKEELSKFVPKAFEYEPLSSA